jgi:hypothetical protein
MHARRAKTLAGVVLTACLAGDLSAGAELRRCVGADGRVVFTDDAGRCPGTEPIEAPDSVQRVDPAAAGRGPASRRYGGRDHKLDRQAEAAEAARWQQKKAAKESELRQLEGRREYLRRYVAHCNRGGSVLTRDASGIKRTVSCAAVRGEFESLEAREASLRDYLESGLAEECRRAGCLPGWIR